MTEWRDKFLLRQTCSIYWFLSCDYIYCFIISYLKTIFLTGKSNNISKQAYAKNHKQASSKIEKSIRKFFQCFTEFKKVKV